MAHTWKNVSVHLDASTQDALDLLIRKTGLSRSAVIRLAVNRMERMKASDLKSALEGIE